MSTWKDHKPVDERHALRALKEFLDLALRTGFEGTAAYNRSDQGYPLSTLSRRGNRPPSS